MRLRCRCVRMNKLKLVPHMLKSPADLAQAGSILSKIGGTPLVKLRRIAEDLPGIEIYCKAEYFNPGGSVEDRPAAQASCRRDRSIRAM